MPLKIIADSSCNLTEEDITQNDIEIIPYLISFGDDNYYEDFFELNGKSFFETLKRRNCRPRTSTPSFDAFLSVFEKYASKGYDVIYISMTSAFTSGYNFAAMAAAQVRERYGVNAAAIDSQTGMILEGFLVLETVRLYKEGKPFGEIVEAINGLKKSVGISFSLDTLAYAVRGGRLGKMGAAIGDFLSIKPVILFKDGGLSLYSKVRTRKKAIENIIDLAIGQTKGFIKDKVTFVLLHAEAYDEVSELGRRFTERTGYSFLEPPEYICAAIGAHTGPRAIGVGFYVSR